LFRSPLEAFAGHRFRNSAIIKAMAQYCVYCGARLHDEGDYCHACGKSRIADADGPGPAVKPVVLPPDAEKTFFKNGAVTVTNTRFTAPGRVFAMSDVRGARAERADSKTPWPTLLYMLGLAAFLARLYRLGLVLFIVGALLSLFFKPKSTVVLDSASGEVRAVTSRDPDYIAAIVDAVKKAIMYGK
jgi:hypothetical protein